MRARISLALALHNHQPVGNFGWVIARRLRARLRADGRRPRAPSRASASPSTTRVPCSTGCAAERPAFLERVAALVGAGRVELLGGGYYEPVLASLPERRPARPAPAHGRRDRAHRRPPARRRLAGRAGLGAGPARGPRRWRLSLDDPRRRPLPGRLDRRVRPVGLVHDRRPGPPADGVRVRQEPALPDPVRGGRRCHRLPGRARVTGPPPAGGHGRRRREVRGVAGHVRALLGHGRLGRPLLRRADRERGLDRPRDPRRMDRPGAAAGPRLRADVVVLRDGRVGAAGRGGARLRTGGRGRRGPRPPGGALDARRLLAQLPGEVPRDQRPPQADAPDVGQGRPDGRRARARRRAPGADAGPEQRLLLARRLRRDLHRPHAPRHVRAPDRGRGRRGHGRSSGRRNGRRDRPRRHGPGRPRRDPRHVAGPDRRDRRGRGRRDRVVGHPGGPPRADGGHAPASRGLPPAPRRQRGSAGSAATELPAAGDAARRVDRGGEHPRGRPVPRTGPRGPAPVRRLRAPLRARPPVRAGHDARGLRPGRGRGAR